MQAADRMKAALQAYEGGISLHLNNNPPKDALDAAKLDFENKKKQAKVAGNAYLECLCKLCPEYAKKIPGMPPCNPPSEEVRPAVGTPGSDKQEPVPPPRPERVQNKVGNSTVNPLAPVMDATCPDCDLDYLDWQGDYSTLRELKAQEATAATAYEQAVDKALIAHGIDPAAYHKDPRASSYNPDNDVQGALSAYNQATSARVNAQKKVAQDKDEYSNCVAECHRKKVAAPGNSDASQIAGKLPQEPSAKPPVAGPIAPPIGDQSQNVAGKNDIPRPRSPSPMLGAKLSGPPVKDPACSPKCDSAFSALLDAHQKAYYLFSDSYWLSPGAVPPSALADAEAEMDKKQQEYDACVAECHRTMGGLGGLTPSPCEDQHLGGCSPPPLSPCAPTDSGCTTTPPGCAGQGCAGAAPNACGGLGQPTCQDTPLTPVTGGAAGGARVTTPQGVPFDATCPQCRGEYDQFVAAVNRVIDLETAFNDIYNAYRDAYDNAIAKGFPQASLAPGSMDPNAAASDPVIGAVAATQRTLVEARQQLAAARDDRTNKYLAYRACQAKCHSSDTNQIAGRLPQGPAAKPPIAGPIAPPPIGQNQNATGKNGTPSPQLPSPTAGPYPVEDAACSPKCDIDYFAWSGAYLKLQELISKGSPPSAIAAAKAEMDRNHQDYDACVAECHRTTGAPGGLTPSPCEDQHLGGCSPPPLSPCAPKDPGCITTPKDCTGPECSPPLAVERDGGKNANGGTRPSRGGRIIDKNTTVYDIPSGGECPFCDELKQAATYWLSIAEGQVSVSSTSSALSKAMDAGQAYIDCVREHCPRFATMIPGLPQRTAPPTNPSEPIVPETPPVDNNDFNPPQPDGEIGKVVNPAGGGNTPTFANCSIESGSDAACSYDGSNGDLTINGSTPTSSAGGGGPNPIVITIQIMIVAEPMDALASQITSPRGHSEAAEGRLASLRAPPPEISLDARGAALQLASLRFSDDFFSPLPRKHSPALPLQQSNPAKNPRFEVSVVANGKSSGEAFELQVADPTGKVKRARIPEGTVLEPMKRGSAQQASARGGGNTLKQQLTAYCLEFAKLPPETGMLFRLADPATQEKFKPLRSVLKAGRELAASGQLHPDSNPKAYVDSIRQYAVWTKLENWDQQKFTGMFVERTRKNAEALHVKWTPEMENALRAAAPGRWRDISQVLEQAQALDRAAKAAPVTAPPVH
jgi:hypothetical protein